MYQANELKLNLIKLNLSHLNQGLKSCFELGILSLDGVKQCHVILPLLTYDADGTNDEEEEEAEVHLLLLMLERASHDMDKTLISPITLLDIIDDESLLVHQTIHLISQLIKPKTQNLLAFTHPWWK